MKILKPGKVEMRKFVCPKCGCEFASSESEMNGDIELMVCPQDGCHYYAMAWEDGEPYEEPVRDAETELTLLIESGPVVPINLANYLIQHGVTLKEE